MKQEPAYEITIDSDRSTIASVVLVFLFCVALVIVTIRQLLVGHVMRASWGTVLIALSCTVAAVIYKETHLNLAFALIGIEAAGRIIMRYVYASYAFRHVLAIGRLTLKTVGLLIVMFAIVKWFRSVIHRMPIPKPEEPTQ